MAKLAGTMSAALLLVLGGCGLIDESDLELGTSLDDGVDAADPDAAGTGEPHHHDDTAARDTVATAPTSETTVDAGPGETFVDPQGSYELDVDPAWIPRHGAVAAEIEIWFLERPQGRFGTNVNVLTQLVPGMELDEYLDVSIENADVLIEDGHVVASGIVEGTHEPLAFMEYAGTQAGVRMRFLGYFTVRDGKAVVATLTAVAEEFDSARAEAEPYLLTLRSTPA